MQGSGPCRQSSPVSFERTKLALFYTGGSVRFSDQCASGDLGLMDIQTDDNVKECRSFHNTSKMGLNL